SAAGGYVPAYESCGVCGAINTKKIKIIKLLIRSLKLFSDCSGVTHRVTSAIFFCTILMQMIKLSKNNVF
ncbi:hypothetical protein ABEQ76_13765, partial [Bacillus velezensis]